MDEYDLILHLQRQRDFSERTFGPGKRTKGILNHIRKELKEIEEDPSDILEWVDLIALAFDGLMRQGYTPQQICGGLLTKLMINENRDWPDWRELSEDDPIEHNGSNDDTKEEKRRA